MLQSEEAGHKTELSHISRERSGNPALQQFGETTALKVEKWKLKAYKLSNYTSML